MVILNSELEHQVVQNITKEAPGVAGVQTTWSFYAGIRAPVPKDGEPVVYKTVLSKYLIIIIFQIQATACSIHKIRHSVFHLPLSSGGVACRMAEFNTVLCLETRARK